MAVTEAGDSIQLPVEGLDGVDRVGNLLAGLPEPRLKRDPQRLLPFEACKPYLAVRRSIGNDAGAHIRFEHQTGTTAARRTEKYSALPMAAA